MTVMIGIDPHKASHTAVVIDNTECVLDELRVRACSKQTDQLRSWAAPFPDRVWAIESARGLGYLLAQQLVAAGEIVVDVPPVLSTRTRLLGSGKSQKNDPNDARSIAIAALRNDALGRVVLDDHARVLKLLVETASRSRSLEEQSGVSPACVVDGTRAWRHGQGNDGDQGKRDPRPRRTRNSDHRAPPRRRPRDPRRHRPLRDTDEGLTEAAPLCGRRIRNVVGRHSRCRRRGRCDDHRPDR